MSSPVRLHAARTAAALILAALAAAAVSGCPEENVRWPRKEKVGGRCPYYPSVPQYEVIFTSGGRDSRRVVRLGWLGVLEERFDGTGLKRRKATRPRCFDEASLAEFHGLLVAGAGIRGLDPAYAPKGAEILKAGTPKRLEFREPGADLTVTWFEGSDIPEHLRRIEAHVERVAEELRRLDAD